MLASLEVVCQGDCGRVWNPPLRETSPVLAAEETGFPSPISTCVTREVFSATPAHYDEVYYLAELEER